MKGVYIILAEGFEEIEALATLDVLRRGGIDVSTVSITEEEIVKGAHGVSVVADMTRSMFNEKAGVEGTSGKDVLVFPGGMPGTTNLAKDAELIGLMNRHYAEGGTLAAICAAPGLVLSQLPSLKGKRFTCYDGCETAPIAKGGEYVKSSYVADGNLITGRGPGSAVDFALAIVEHQKGSALAKEIRAGMMIIE